MFCGYENIQHGRLRRVNRNRILMIMTTKPDGRTDPQKFQPRRRRRRHCDPIPMLGGMQQRMVACISYCLLTKTTTTTTTRSTYVATCASCFGVFGCGHQQQRRWRIDDENDNNEAHERNVVIISLSFSKLESSTVQDVCPIES